MDKVDYLNLNPITGNDELYPDPMFSKLLLLLKEMKQPRAAPAQWIGIIKAFNQKGVKQAEIDDCQILDYLETLEPTDKVTKEQLQKRIQSRMPLIKRVDLEHPIYAGYTSVAGKYTERLYILSSEAMRADDEMEDLMFQIEDLGFNPGPLLEDPGLVDRLELRYKMISKVRPDMYDFKHHHHSAIIDKHGKNLMAHSRFVKSEDGVFFIQEVQSDWAQRGRRTNWGIGYPKAPFVSNTEQWAGVVLRDLLHEAALDPSCKQVAWINSGMRNGWDRSEETQTDDLATFYDTIVRKIAEKALGKSGEKPHVISVHTKQNKNVEVLGFEMTEKARAELIKPQPLYSREGVLPYGFRFEDPERTQERVAILNECKVMIGNARTISFVNKLYDISQGTEVSGQYLNRGITLSLRAQNLDRAGRHEMWHFASENLLRDHERRNMRLEFGPGSPLNDKTKSVLLGLGMKHAADQCIDHNECAAHAFSLWMEGRLDVTEKPAGIFWQVAGAVSKIGDWLSEKVFGVKVESPEQLFESFRSGALRVRQEVEQHNASSVPMQMQP